MRDVQDLLRVLYVPEEHHDKLEGSCEWIEDREDFQAWIGAESGNEPRQTYRPSIFWVQAHPGAGKTVLAAHIVSQLSHFRLPHASYFFHFGKKSAQSLAGLLQSLALQMAIANPSIREKLVEIHTTGSSFDLDDARTVWQKIFIGGIFQVRYNPRLLMLKQGCSLTRFRCPLPNCNFGSSMRSTNVSNTPNFSLF
jgi:hypothetical protein